MLSIVEILISELTVPGDTGIGPALPPEKSVPFTPVPLVVLKL